MNTAITADDYPGIFGEGQVPGLDGLRVFEEARKAMEATGALPRTGPGANALELEDALPTLKSAEIRRGKQLNLWPNIPKRKAYGLVAEGSRVDDLGDFGAPGFIAGNDSGNVTDATYTRWSKEIKYLAVLAEITLPTTLITAIGYDGRGVNAEATQEANKMDELLRHVERNLWFGDSNIHATQWDGFKKQITDGATVANGIRLDLRGAPPDKDLIENLSYIANVNSTDLNKLWFTHEGIRDLRQSLYDEQRIPEGYRGAVGADFDRFLIEALGGTPDTLKVLRNHMLSPGVKGGRPRVEPTAAAAGAPTAPTSVTSAAATVTATDYAPGLPAATYLYGVTAIGKGGRSLATALGSGQTVTAGQGVTLTIVDADPNVQYYEVFRNPYGTTAVAGNRRFQAVVARSGVSTTWTDDGKCIPDTSEAAAMYVAEDEVIFNQLLPVVKRRLPIALMAERFAFLIFGTPIVQVPTHNIWITNIGRRSQSGVYSVA